MKKNLIIGTLLIISTIILVSCSSTILTGSWSDPAYNKRVDKIYIVGVSKQETHRRIFEDEFGSELQMYGIKTVSSYRDLKNAEKANLDEILQKVQKNEADSLLMTRIIDKRTEEVVNPGRVTNYGSYYGSRDYGYRDHNYRSYYPRSYYRNYHDYYPRRYEMVYEPATISKFKVITLESNLYDAETGNLIWSAQLETVMEGTIKDMIHDYIEVVTKDLVDQGVI